MSRIAIGVLAAGTALLGLTTTPATAAPAPEATVAAYVYSDGTTTEGLTGENTDLTAQFIASGYTTAHAGWDIRLSDEAFAPVQPALPTQDYRARASHTDTGANAGTNGFVSLVDGGTVPFAVVRPFSRSVSCTVDGPFFNGGGGGHGVWVRNAAGTLDKIDVDSIGTTTAAPAGQANGTPVPTTLKVNRYSTTAQLAGYSAFAKYDGRTKSGASAWELEITQGTQVHRVLVGAQAASC
ncbi:hypothetical protein [Lentzea sp. NPDC055074]